MNTDNHDTMPPSPARSSHPDDEMESEVIDVIDTIAYIEMNRQVMEREQGTEAARREALRKLNEALALEQALAQKNGGTSVHASNAEALTNAIDKVKGLPYTQNHGAHPAQPGVMRQHAARSDPMRQHSGKPGPMRQPNQSNQSNQPNARPAAPQNPKRSRGRRNTGRHGSR
jgi:hypothetical protein